MLAAYFTPLAPAAILLLSALILPIVVPRLPATDRRISDFAASGFVGLALLSLLGIRISFDGDIEGQLLSGWNFSTVEFASALVVRTDALSLPFLIVTLLVLFIATLLFSEVEDKQWLQVSGWLALGAAACLLFVSANVITVVYAVLLFDITAAFYWLQKGFSNFGMARLFLGILTAVGLVLSSLAPESGLLMLGVVLLLRLGVYPFTEATAGAARSGEEQLVYFGLSFAVGGYLAVQTLSQPLPTIVQWLVVITMLFSGLLAWLYPTTFANFGTAPHGDASPAELGQNKGRLLLVWLVVAETLLLFVASPLDATIATAFAVSLILSFTALWVTPALGKPDFRQASRFWPYLLAVAAILTLVGAPFFLMWPARISIYQSLLRTDSLLVLIGIIVAGSLAFSGLVRYGLVLRHSDERVDWRSWVGVIAVVPFLLPILGPFIFSTITKGDTPFTNSVPSFGAVLINVVVIGAAIGLGYFRTPIVIRLNLPVETIIQLARLQWLFLWSESGLNQLSKALLRVRVTLEGQHYLGWAVLVTLVGVLVFLLN